MAITFLKKAKANLPSRSVKYWLHQHLNGPDPARPISVIHASELTKEKGFCPREYALYDLTKKKPKDGWLSTSQEVTYEIGRVLQDSVVNWFADMGKAICHWKCVACGAMHQFQTRPFKCESCGYKTFKPKEVRFESQITGASCGIDMILGMGEEKLRPIELKTMDKDEFKALAAPLAEHRVRTNLYLRIIAESGHPWANKVSSTRATVFYISKGGFGCADEQLKQWGIKESYSPFKEYEIDRNDEETDIYAVRSKAVKDFRTGEEGVPFGICSTPMAKRASGCLMKEACFSGQFPPVNDWSEE